MVDRLRPAKDLVRLMQLLSGHQVMGLTVEEIAAEMEVSERTVRRYLAALGDIEPDLDFFLEEGSRKRYWRLSKVRTPLPAVSARQLSDLTAAATFMRHQGHEHYAQIIQSLRDRLQAGLDRSTLVRMDPDLEVLDTAVEVTYRPGPKVSFDPQIRQVILDAILADRQVSFAYVNIRGEDRGVRQVSPHGLVMGPQAYLVGHDERAQGVRNFALTGIRGITICDDKGRTGTFDMNEYVTRSFGAFHDGQFHDWQLCFKATAAHELDGYQFHPSQTIVQLPDGRVLVSFRSESVREVAYECFRWSEHLISIAPDALRSIVSEICDNMRAAVVA